MSQNASPARELLGAGQVDDSVYVFLDESYEPFVAAAAVAVESSDVRRLDSSIGATYEQVQGRYYLGGMPSFDDFRRRGFHASSDALEIRIAFVAFLAEALNFKSMISFSDGTSRSDLSDKKRLMIVFDQLIHDVLGAYRSRPKVTFYFESSQGIDKYLERLVERATRSFGRKVPEVEVLFGTKQEPHMLAVPDYVLYIFNQWRLTQGSETLALNPGQHQSRSLKAILGSISVARSIEDALVLRRTLQ